MNASLILICVEILLITILFILIYILLTAITNNYEKRFEQYTITSIKDNTPTLFERVFSNIWKIIKKISKLLNKSELLNRYGTSFNKYINYKDINKIKGIDYISIKFIISICFSIIYLLSTLIKVNYNPIMLLLVFIISFFILDIYFIFEYRNRKKIIESELLSAIIIMNNAFKSGMNIMQAVNIVENELDGAIKEEFKKINLDIKYGLSLETVFERFYNRVKIEDIKSIASSLSLINKTGGNIVKVFSSIEKNFYDKKRIKEEMNSLVSSSIFMYRLLISLPILLSLIIFVINPDYFSPLIKTDIGKIIILLVLILYIIYTFIIKKIMRVKM